MSTTAIEYYVTERRKYGDDWKIHSEEGPYHFHKAITIRDEKNSEIKTNDCKYTVEARP